MSSIKGIRAWFSRKYGEADYYLTELFSGHGYSKFVYGKILFKSVYWLPIKTVIPIQAKFG